MHPSFAKTAVSDDRGSRARAHLTLGDGVDTEQARVVVARVERSVRVAYLPRRHRQRLPQGGNHVCPWPETEGESSRQRRRKIAIYRKHAVSSPWFQPTQAAKSQREWGCRSSTSIAEQQQQQQQQAAVPTQYLARLPRTPSTAPSLDDPTHNTFMPYLAAIACYAVTHDGRKRKKRIAAALHSDP